MLRQEKGQTSTEYMLLVSVVVIAVIAAAYTFVPGFQAGVSSLATDVQTILGSGQIGGVGAVRNGGAQANAPVPPDNVVHHPGGTGTFCTPGSQNC